MSRPVSPADVISELLTLGRIPDRDNGVRRTGSTRITMWIGCGLLIVLFGACLLHSLLGLPKPNVQDLNNVLAAPSRAHLFGTDDLGRDVLSRTLTGGALDLSVGIMLAVVSAGIGISIGAYAGFVGGRSETAVMRLTDVALAFPFLVLVIAIVAIIGTGLIGIIVGVLVADWAFYARITRAEALVLREREFILAARTLGLSQRRILARHVLPNVWRPAVVYLTADIVICMLAIASLSFVGLGVQPPAAEWGQIIADGQPYILGSWWISTLPGAVMVLAGVGFSLVGDSLSEILGQEVRFG